MNQKIKLKKNQKQKIYMECKLQKDYESIASSKQTKYTKSKHDSSQTSG